MNGYKQARIELDLNIKEMAIACGVHRDTYGKWERNVRTPDKAADRLINTLLWLKSKNMLSQYLEQFRPEV